MDQELMDRLDRIEKSVADNNRMLTKMRKAQKRAAYRSVLYWIVIIALTIWGLYALVPYITKLGAQYGIGSSSTSGSASTVSSLNSLIQQYEKGQKTAQ